MTLQEAWNKLMAALEEGDAVELYAEKGGRSEVTIQPESGDYVGADAATPEEALKKARAKYLGATV